jgi:hypothetical protein
MVSAPRAVRSVAAVEKLPLRARWQLRLDSLQFELSAARREWQTMAATEESKGDDDEDEVEKKLLEQAGKLHHQVLIRPLPSWAELRCVTHRIPTFDDAGDCHEPTEPQPKPKAR